MRETMMLSVESVNNSQFHFILIFTPLSMFSRTKDLLATQSELRLTGRRVYLHKLHIITRIIQAVWRIVIIGVIASIPWDSWDFSAARTCLESLDILYMYSVVCSCLCLENTPCHSFTDLPKLHLFSGSRGMSVQQNQNDEQK